MWLIVQMLFTFKMKLNYWDLSDRVQSMPKIENKLSWLIRLSVIYDENQTGQ